MHTLCVDAYTGMGGFYDGTYLYKYPRESDYGSRKEYSDYKNQFKGIVDSLISPVFANEITREGLTPLSEAFVDNCSGSGISMNDMMEEVETYQEVCGNVFVIMDNYKEIPDRVEDAVNEGKYPYIYFKLPNEVHKYKKDRFGNLTEIEFYYETIEGEDKVREKVYRHIDASQQYDFTLDGSGSHIVRGEKIASVSSGLPVVMSGNEIMPIPNMYDMAVMAKTVYNKSSELREIERKSNFNLLQLPGNKPDKDVEVSELIWVPEDSTVDAKWISPDSNTMKNAMESEQQSASDLEDIARSKGAVPMVDQAKSGVAYAYEFVGNTDSLKNTAQNAEDVEMEIFELFAEVSGTNDSVEVSYDQNYTPGRTQLEDSKKTLEEAIDRQISPTFNKEANKSLVNVVDQIAQMNMDESTISKIEKEIDKTTSLSTLETMSRISLGGAVGVEIDSSLLDYLGSSVDKSVLVGEVKQEEEIVEGE